MARARKPKIISLSLSKQNDLHTYFRFVFTLFCFCFLGQLIWYRLAISWEPEGFALLKTPFLFGSARREGLLASRRTLLQEDRTKYTIMYSFGTRQT